MRTVHATLFSLGGAALVSLALSATDATDAAAQPASGESTAMAEALFQQGRDLFKRQQYPEACAKLAESQRLEAKVGTLLNLALCHEKLGELAGAWAEYTSVATLAHREGHKERERFAREQIKALEKRLSHIVIGGAGLPAGGVVKLDGATLVPAALNTPLPVSPGKHHVVVTAPGKVEWVTTFEVPPSRSEVNVTLPALVDAAPPVLPPAPPVVAQPVTPAPLVPTAPQAELPVGPVPARNVGPALIYTGFGVGAAGILVGAITGAVTLGRSGALVKACAHGCPVGQQGELHTLDTLANVSNVGFAFGAAGVGVGIAGIFVSRAHAQTTRTGMALAPFISPELAGVQGRF